MDALPNLQQHQPFRAAIRRHPRRPASNVRAHLHCLPGGYPGKGALAMENELQALTEPGRELVALAERFSAEFSVRAGELDRTGEFAREELDALRSSRLLYAPAPVEAGGMGVESIHDLMVASSRLARGNASITLGLNMHLLVLQSFVRQRRMAANRGDRARVDAITSILREFADSKAFIAAAVSEPDQDLLRPATMARFDGEVWRVDGRKIICSGAPGATHFSVAVTVDDPAGERYAYALIPRTAPGVSVLDDWEAMGMRASGSCSVVFDNVPMEGRGPGKGAPASVLNADHLEQILASGPAHTAAALGVAEAAHAAAIDAVCKKRRRSSGSAVRPFVQERAAENSIDLAAARAVFARSLTMIDEYHESHPCERGTLDEVMAVFAEVQRAKAFINQAAVRIADRAIAMAGGAGYMSSNALSRHYRDARAGAFMHPLGVNVAIEFLGAHSLGLRPETF